jgi:exosome complex RNA-binding protein Rrp42 (RNase PH superfamily)
MFDFSVSDEVLAFRHNIPVSVTVSEIAGVLLIDCSTEEEYLV